MGAERLLLSLATNMPSRWRVGDFFGRGGEVEFVPRLGGCQRSRQTWLGGVTGPSSPVADRWDPHVNLRRGQPQLLSHITIVEETLVWSS